MAIEGCMVGGGNEVRGNMGSPDTFICARPCLPQTKGVYSISNHEFTYFPLTKGVFALSHN